MNRITLDSLYKKENPKEDVANSTLHFHPAEQFGYESGHCYQYEAGAFLSEPFQTEAEFIAMITGTPKQQKVTKKTVVEKAKDVVKKAVKKATKK